MVSRDDTTGVRDLTQADTSVLLREAARLEAGQAGHFTTALHDAERRYLDVMAELYRRGEMRPCTPEPAADQAPEPSL